MAQDREIAIVDRLARRFKTKDPGVVVGIGDDAAVLRRDKKSYWLLTADMLVESVHFATRENRQRVGYKAVAVSVSDIAAMGGLPKYALISVGVPPRQAGRTVAQLAKGFARASRMFGIAVIGGDTNRSGRLVLDVTVVGAVERRHLVLRSGGRDKDILFVSGPLGGSRARRHLSFVPRLEAARFLVKHFKVNAMMDLSDGLAKDLGRMARASHLGAVLDAKSIPVHRHARGIDAALYDGEDFELLVSLPESEGERLLHQVRRKKTPLRFYPVGRLTRRVRGVWLSDRHGRRRRLGSGGFAHF